MELLGTRTFTLSAAALLLALFAHGLSAQWPETFTTQGQLPAGWSHSPGGTGATLWNVDANGNYRPSAPLQGNFDPFRTGQYSLNWNDSVRAYPGTQNSGALERGVLTPMIDVTFAPNPTLSFWTLWDRFDTTSSFHIMQVRVWNTNYSVMHYSETMPLAGGLTPWHNRTIPLDRNWGQIRIEFYYKCGQPPNTEKNAAGWFIDDVDITGLTPPTFGIVQPNNLGTHVTGSNMSVQLTTDYGTLPAQGWNLVSGTLPQGVSITATGEIAGTPTDAGIFTFRIGVQDSSTPPLTASKDFSLTINRGPGFVYPVLSLPFEDNFSTDKGWVFSTGNATPQYGPSLGGYSDTSQGGWERGPTSASAPASAFDNGDPPNDNTQASQDNMVLAVVAGGPIPVSVQLGPWYWAYSPQIEVSGNQEVDVYFHRWMNCHQPTAHNAEVQIWNPVSNVWMNVWTMTTGQTMSTQWIETSKSINFGSAPASNATTRLRFGYQVTSQLAISTYRGGGFTVDDVKILKKPQPNILRLLDFTVVSPHPPVGSYPRMYEGSSYSMLILLENTSTEDIALSFYSQKQESVSGPPPWTSENVGHMVPTLPTPWIIPPGVHYLSYDTANPPSGAGPEIAHIDFLATAIPTTGSGGSVRYDIQLIGQEVGGHQRVVVADSASNPAGTELIHVFTVPALAITDPTNLPSATVGVPYVYALSAQYGTLPYQNWQIVAGPSWMTMNGNQLEFTATPTDVPHPPQSFQVTIQVSDSATPPADADKTFSITVQPGLAPLQIITPQQLPSAREGVPYAGGGVLNYTGGLPPYTWSSFAWLAPPTGNGALPGMSFNLALGQLTGTPAAGAQGNYAFSVTLTDSTVPVPYSITSTFFITVLPANNFVSILTPTQLTAPGAPPLGLVTAPYNGGMPFRFEATGGIVGPPGSEYSWAVTQGQIPPGLALDAHSGEVSGVPLVAGTYVFALSASDGAFPPSVGVSIFTIHVDAPTLNPLQIVTVASLPQGHEGNLYQHVLQGMYGTTPYTWGLKAGSSLPAGLHINPQSGALGGVISAGQAVAPSETFTFTITLEDSAPLPASVEKTFTLNVVAFVAGPLAIVTPQNLPQGGVFSPYSTAIRASGGNSANPAVPYVFGLEAGSALPPGLSLAANGTLDGVPSAVGTYSFVVECSDGTAGFATAAFSLQVNDNSVTTEIKPGSEERELVPFWEACSLGHGGGGISVLVVASLALLSLRRQRRSRGSL